MAFKITYLENEGGVITSYWGTMTDDDVINSGLEKYSLMDKVKNYKYSLTDLSNVKSSKITAKSVRRNVEVTAKILKDIKDILIVFVLPQDVQYGMGRMWQAYAENINIDSHVCRIRSEADELIKNHLAKTQNKNKS